MEAQILPLGHKYYGTVVRIDDDGRSYEITLWDSGDYIPSDRELQDRGHTREDYDKNITIDDGFGGKIKIQDDEWDWGHCESRGTHDFAQKLVLLLNEATR
jgi:hypothetical protein